MLCAPLVRVVRSGLEESVHAGDVAVSDPGGRLVAWAGDPDRVAYARSSMKPLQAAVSLAFGPLGSTDEEVALMCASHNAEPVHVAVVRLILARAGVEETALQCPAMLPWDEGTRLADPRRMPINSDCSGKHGGMLAACLEQGWDPAEYRDPGHPLQRAVLEAVLAGSGLDEVRVGVDGCGVPVHGMPLRAMATVYARLAAPDRLGNLAGTASRAIGAMQAHPYLVAGRNRVDTAVMRVRPGVVVKAGAEGMICAALPGRDLGVAVKIRDGAPRASGPALIRVLRLLEALDDAAVAELVDHAMPPVMGGGERVGELVSEFGLSTG